MGIRIGVIGAGKFGYNHLLTLTQLARQDRVETVALADISTELVEARRREFGIEGYRDYREMIEREKLTAVTIATPDHLHREIGLHAARSGMHLLVEKPLDVTEEGCREIIAAAAGNEVLLQVDFHKRFDPDHREMARRVRDGALGRVLYGYAHMEDRIEVPGEWFPQRAGQSSPAWFLGIHFFDLVRWTIKAEPARVSATAQKGKLAGMGVDAFDAMQTKVDFDNGASVSFDTSWILPNGFEAIVNQGVRLVGTEGIFEVDSQDRGASSCLTGEGMRTYNNNFIRSAPGKDGRLLYAGYGIESIADFVENLEFLRQGGSLQELAGACPDGHDALQATRIALAAHQSIERNEPVYISGEPPATGEGHAHQRSRC